MQNLKVLIILPLHCTGFFFLFHLSFSVLFSGFGGSEELGADRQVEAVHFKSTPMYFPIFPHSKEKESWFFWCFFFVKQTSPKKVFLSTVHANLVQFQ